MSVTLIDAEGPPQVAADPVASGRAAATQGLDAAHRFLADPANQAEIGCALRIRAVENGLFDLFGKGRLHGTIHTCIGQEFSGAMLGKHLQGDDFVTSNHRCHGHFIAATGQWRGLIDELVGNADGVCAGIGSSQHLWAPNFLSNGQQGGMLPVAAGIALDRRLRGSPGVAVSFTGEGTLGEGVLYETLNLASLWQLPHILIVENNYYSQSTPQARSVAGSIAARAAAFGVPAVRASTWDLSGFDAALATAMARARSGGGPTMIVLATYRLNPHSKGDDGRERAEIDWFRAHDPASLAVQDYRHYAALYQHNVAEVAEAIAEALAKPALDPASYFPDQLPRADAAAQVWTELPPPADTGPRVAQQLNDFYRGWLDHDPTSVFIGEDIEDPYGGAFKIAKGFTTAYPDRVRTTPISEAAITGIGVGLAVSGRHALVEIMFGDFITYAFDQILNNASKMFHMYNKKLDCPVVVRTPMGGRRGYGPTHSQSLERFLVGIDNCCTVSLTSVAAVAPQLAGLPGLRCPVVLLENKSDYTLKTYVAPDGLVLERNAALLPTLRLRAAHAAPDVTLLAYGGMARFVANGLLEIFERCDAVPELIVPTSLSPLDLAPIAASVRRTGRLLVIEEGAAFAGPGAEAVAQLAQQAPGFAVRRVSGKAAPVPSAPTLETAALPSLDEICAAVIALLAGQP